jgi:hypothetical protein
MTLLSIDPRLLSSALDIENLVWPYRLDYADPMIKDIVQQRMTWMTMRLFGQDAFFRVGPESTGRLLRMTSNNSRMTGQQITAGGSSYGAHSKSARPTTGIIPGGNIVIPGTSGRPR